MKKRIVGILLYCLLTGFFNGYVIMPNFGVVAYIIFMGISLVGAFLLGSELADYQYRK